MIKPNTPDHFSAILKDQETYISEENKPKAEKHKTTFFNVKLSPKKFIAARAFSLFNLKSPHFRNIDLYNTKLEDVTKDDLQKISYAERRFIELKNYYDVFKSGHVFENKVSEYKSELNVSDEEDIIALSKIWKNHEALIVYNTADCEAKYKFVTINNALNQTTQKLTPLYGYESFGHVDVRHSTINGQDTSYVKLYLLPLHLVILKNF